MQGVRKNSRLGRIKSKYTKQTKRKARKALGQADRKPDGKNLVAIYNTLTEKESRIMFLVAFETACFSSPAIKNFYKNLNALSERK